MPQIQDRHVQFFIDEFQNPIQSCAEFYGYYYLSEIEQKEELDFDLQQKTDQLYNGFYAYGVYAVLRELTNIPSQVVVNVNEFKQVAGRMGVMFASHHIDSDQAAIGRLANLIASPPLRDRVVGTFIDENLQQNHDLGGTQLISTVDKIHSQTKKLNVADPDRQRIATILEKAEKDLNAKTKPQRLLLLASDIFDSFFWQPPFGGPSWIDVCDLLLARQDTAKKIWVDMAWATEHNTSAWVNKVPYNRAIDGYIESNIQRVPEYFDAERGMNDSYQVSEVLETILDHKREGEFYKFWPFVIDADRDLTIYKNILQEAGR